MHGELCFDREGKTTGLVHLQHDMFVEVFELRRTTLAAFTAADLVNLLGVVSPRANCVAKRSTEKPIEHRRSYSHPGLQRVDAPTSNAIGSIDHRLICRSLKALTCVGMEHGVSGRENRSGSAAKSLFRITHYCGVIFAVNTI